MPSPEHEPHWNDFWRNKTNQMKRDGVHVYTRSVRYSDCEITMPDGTVKVGKKGREKGIDIRISLDIIRAALVNWCDGMLIFSQDQDFYEVVKDIMIIAEEQERHIAIVSAFPYSDSLDHNRGIYKTSWYRITKEEYDRCIDHREYRTKKERKKHRREF